MKERYCSKTSQVIDGVGGTIVAFKLWGFEVLREWCCKILLSKGGSLLKLLLGVEERFWIASMH